jgi:hypothetical protein
MNLRMGLSHPCQSERPKWAGDRFAAPQPLVLAPESALGSHPCVALSSAQVNLIITRAFA